MTKEEFVDRHRPNTGFEVFNRKLEEDLNELIKQVAHDAFDAGRWTSITFETHMKCI